MRLEPGDILLTTSPTAWLSKAIRFFEDHGKVSHAAGITIAGEDMNASAVEAESPTTVEHTLHQAYDNNDEQLVVFRPVDLTDADKEKIVNKLRTYIGREYGYFKLLLCAADAAFGGRYIFRRIGRMDRFPICSWEVAWAFDQLKKNFFGVPKDGCEPSDIWDFIVKNPDSFKFIWQRGQLWPQGKDK